MFHRLSETCASSAKTSTLEIRIMKATVYVKIEYQIDSLMGGNKKFTFLFLEESTNGTAATHTVPHGSAITWRVTDSFTSATLDNIMRQIY